VSRVLLRPLRNTAIHVPPRSKTTCDFRRLHGRMEISGASRSPRSRRFAAVNVQRSWCRLGRHGDKSATA
jgi:hypothetical protein